MSTLSIKVNIAGRMYPLTIESDEEETIRKAAGTINDNIKHLQENYAVKDMQDLLAMTALQSATELTNTTKSVEFDKLMQDVESIQKELDSLL